MITPLHRSLLKAGLPFLLVWSFGLQAECQDRGRDRFIEVFLPSGKSVTAELAVSDEERARGLMFREKILPDQGMLFVFETEDLHSFWMKNTLVVLDMLWLDSEKGSSTSRLMSPPARAIPALHTDRGCRPVMCSSSRAGGPRWTGSRSETGSSSSCRNGPGKSSAEAESRSQGAFSFSP